MNHDILTALINLKESSLDFEKHQVIWASTLHLFPDKWLPPLRIPKNFSYAQFNSEALHQIKISEYRMKKISDYLILKKIPQINHGTFPQQAIDLLDNSEIQQILSQDFGDNIKTKDFNEILD